MEATETKKELPKVYIYAFIIVVMVILMVQNRKVLFG